MQNRKKKLERFGVYNILYKYINIFVWFWKTACPGVSDPEGILPNGSSLYTISSCFSVIKIISSFYVHIQNTNLQRPSGDPDLKFETMGNWAVKYYVDLSFLKSQISTRFMDLKDYRGSFFIGLRRKCKWCVSDFTFGQLCVCFIRNDSLYQLLKF